MCVGRYTKNILLKNCRNFRGNHFIFPWRSILAITNVTNYVQLGKSSCEFGSPGWDGLDVGSSVYGACNLCIFAFLIMKFLKTGDQTLEIDRRKTYAKTIVLWCVNEKLLKLFITTINYHIITSFITDHRIFYFDKKFN